MRILLPAAATLIFCMSASAQSYSYEPDTYRHGGTYSTTISGSPDACAQACGADQKCLVWSFRKPDTAAGPAQCELKQSIGHAEENALMISGVSPRFSSDQQAYVPPSADDLLGGETANVERAPEAFTVRATPSPRPAPAPTRSAATSPSPAQTQIRESAFSAPSPAPGANTNGRVLNPTDPRIVRNSANQGAVTAGTSQSPQATRVPAQSVAPAPIRQGRPLPPPPRVSGEQARPYDNLRNREFPRYSVQDNVPLDADSAGGAARGTTGAGS